MKFLDIAIKDLYQLFKDWKPFIFLIAAPIAFTLMFGFMFGGFNSPTAESDSRLPVQVVTEEQTPLTDIILTTLANSDVIQVEATSPETDLAELKQAVADEDLAAVVLIPEGFSGQLQTAGRISLTAILDENTTAGITVEQEIQAISDRIQAAAEAAQLTVDVYTETQGTPDPAAQDELFTRAFDEALGLWQSLPVTAVETQTAPDGAQETSEENAFAHSLPGMMAQFAIAGLMGAAEIIIQERKSGALNRILSTAVPKFSILAGHWLAMFAMIFLQFIVLVIFGQLFLRLDFFAAPGATLLLSIASCAFAASLGLLIGVLAKTPEQSTIFALIPMFVFSGLGGAWVPLDILSEQVQQISRFTPVYWIMIGFRDILLRGAGLPDIQLPILALLGFALVFFVPAVVLFYRQRA